MVEPEAFDRHAHRELAAVLDSEWGRLFRNWETLSPDASGFPDVGAEGAEIGRAGMKAFMRSLGILGTCVQEAPEFLTLRKRQIARRE